MVKMDQHNKEEIGAFIKENITSENTNYNKVRNQYIIERDKERKKIIRDVFESMGYKVKVEMLEREVVNIHLAEKWRNMIYPTGNGLMLKKMRKNVQYICNHLIETLMESETIMFC